MAAVQAVILSTVFAHGAANPTIKSSWSGKYHGIGGVGNTEVDVSFDLPHSFRLDQTIAMPQQPPYHWFTAYGDDPSGWTVNTTINSTFCYPDKKPWSQVVHDFGFGWLSEASQNGTKTIAGSSCQVWVHSQEKRYAWSACIGDDNIPREFSIKADPREAGSSMAAYLSFDISMKGQTFGAPKQLVTEACANWPIPSCPSQGVKTFDAYRDTSFVTPTPDNQNGGDAKGQSITAFIYKSSYVTVYEVTHDTAYGQYAMCNYISNGGVGNKCIGGGNTIGRVALFRMCGGKPRCGQCTPNEDSGSWLSFPREGECASEKDVGTDGCTWKANLKRIVKYDCVMDNATKTICGLSYRHHDNKCMIAFKSKVASCPVVTPPVEKELSPATFVVV